MPRLSLTWKIFLATAGVVAAVLVGALVLTTLSARKTADESIARGLVGTRQRVRTVLDARVEQMTGAAGVFADNPDFRSLVLEARPEDMLDQAEIATEQTRASWVQITDGNGVRLAKSNDPDAPHGSLANSALIGGALNGRPTGGFGASAAGDSLFQAVAVPITGAGAGGGGERIVGVLMAAKLVDSALARSIREATESDVVFYALDEKNEPRVVAATVPTPAKLTDFLKAHMADTTADAPRAEVELGGTHYVGQGGALRAADNRAFGGFMALRSREAVMAPFIRLRNTIALIGLLGLGLSGLLSYLVARAITHPVQSLVRATQRAADGDYTADIPVSSSRDEIGSLATAFRAMLADLRDKQALVRMLGAANAAEQTQPIRTVPTALRTGPVGPGTVLAKRYKITELLGAGGMGTVFKAVDQELGEPVAIKTLKPELAHTDPTILERFKDEIRLARRISHRNVVRVHDLGETDGAYFITMEYVEGTALKDVIATRSRLPVAATLSIMKQLCRGLEVAHEQGVIHRDIKPANLLVTGEGVLKVMDFGIARLLQRTGAAMTQAGMVIGTPQYMAPEQLLGDEVDPRADLYAAAVVCYECLTGRRPFVAENAMAQISMMLEERPVPPKELSPEVPAPLSDLILRTLDPDRNRRPKSAAELEEQFAKIG